MLHPHRWFFILGLCCFVLISCAKKPEMGMSDVGRVRAGADRAAQKVDTPQTPEEKEPSITPKPVTQIESPRTASEKKETVSGGDVWQDGDWIVAIAECSEENIGKYAAMKWTREDARQKATSFGVGILVMSSSMQTDIMSPKDRFSSFLRYTNTFSNGTIIEEQEKWAEQNIGKDRSGLDIKKYQVTLRCKVQREEGSPDPGFSIRMDLNQAAFTEGDKIELTVYPTQNCYLTVFNVNDVEDKVYILFPNDYAKENRCEAKKAIKIPAPESGISFPVYLPRNKLESAELVLVIATKKSIDFSTGLKRESAFAYLPTPVAAVQEINKKLAGIPLNERTQTSETISIQKK